MHVLCIDGLGRYLLRPWLEDTPSFPAVQLTYEGANVSETTRTNFSENSIAALAYITFVPAILFLILPRYNKSSYVRFHAWQSILLNIAAYVVSFTLTLFAVPALQHGAYFILGLTRVGGYVARIVDFGVACGSERKAIQHSTSRINRRKNVPVKGADRRRC
jgi:uncharacterized membrane protein